MTLGKGNKGYIGFYKYTGSKNLAANKAFLIYEPSSQNYATSFSISGVEDLTGIHEVGLTLDSPWYTLQGIKLKGAPRQSGIYIHNGKTVVVK